MFDIGWSEFAVIAVVALIAIGPKELPGVLRMVGQWIGKARKMASEFQGQFQEAMREAEMADLKKSFDEVKEAASGFASGNVMTSLEKDVNAALAIDDKPSSTTEAAASPEASTGTAAEAVASEPLAITPPVEAAAATATADAHPAVLETEAPRDAKAS
jgi:sec-independent protein translocase protein TatB